MVSSAGLPNNLNATLLSRMVKTLLLVMITVTLTLCS